jgi:hypothetical protein
MDKKMEGKSKERRGEGKEAKNGWRSEGDGKGKRKIKQAEDVEERTEKDRERKERRGKEGKNEEGGKGKKKERREAA